jgi:hypothetical protein
MDKLDNIIFKLIDKQVSGCDTYIYNGGIWLIFTDKKQWVVEFTSSGALWYNYYFFNEIFGWIGVSDKINYYVEKWFQLRILNKGKVEDTIQNGVKYTFVNSGLYNVAVEDTIKNGVKHTKSILGVSMELVEDTIKNGVKHTKTRHNCIHPYVEDTVKNGVKCNLIQNNLESEIKIIS